MSGFGSSWIASSIRGDGIAVSESQARSEAIAMIAYLQSLGRVRQAKPVAAAAMGGGQ